MSIEELKSDLDTNIAQLKAMGSIVTTEDLFRHLKHTMWPFMRNIVAEMEEMDEAMAEAFANADDMLQPETAALFTAVVVGGVGIADELEKRLGTSPDDQKLRVAIGEYRNLANEVTKTIDEIMVASPEGDEESDDDGDDDEADDEEEIDE